MGKAVVAPLSLALTAGGPLSLSQVQEPPGQVTTPSHCIPDSLQSQAETQANQ